MTKDPFADDPPPAYTASSSTNVPLEENITGVGIGYGRRDPRPPPPVQQPDTTPTSVPTPGRPLLYRNQLLVYPKGYWCQKCGNTGYKQMDPSNPHETDWRKYGRPFSSALAHSYALSAGGGGLEVSNLQRSLPLMPVHHPQPSPGIWTHPGQGRPPPPAQFAPPPVIYSGNAWVPPNAMVVRPGDARLGGQ